MKYASSKAIFCKLKNIHRQKVRKRINIFFLENIIKQVVLARYNDTYFPSDAFTLLIASNVPGTLVLFCYITVSLLYNHRLSLHPISHGHYMSTL